MVLNSFPVRILASLGMFFFCSAVPAVADISAGTAVAGVLDMSGTTSAGPISLSGEWEFYKDRLLTPKDFEKPPMPEYLTVPSNWDFPGNNPVYHGFGTYRLIIKGLDLKSPVLRVNMISSAFRLFVNGLEAGSAGTVGNGPLSSSARWKPGLLWIPFPLMGPTEVVIQVSNFQDIGGGINRPLEMGEASVMTMDNQGLLLGDMFLCGALLLIGLYHLGLFIFRIRDKSPLWFGLIALLLALRTLVDNHFMVLQIFPSLDLELVLKVNYLTMALGLVLLPQFMADVFPGTAWTPALRIVQGLGLTYALVVVFFPLVVFSEHLSKFHLVILVMAVQISSVLVKALRRNLPGSWVFLAGFVIFIAAVFHDVIKIYIVLPTPPLSPLGMLVFLLFQALVMARKFSAAFTATENFGQYLKRMNVSLERFIPREVLSCLKKDSIMDINLGDHTEMVMTVMFSDIRNFTGLSEKMTPRENFNFINSYLNRMGPIIRNHGGFVDKYMGDGIMALFPGSPAQALEAARAMRAALVVYNEDRSRSGYDPIRIGMGLHTGLLMVGTIGEEGRMDSTVISDAVNLASRLEGLTKVFQEDVLVSSAVVQAMPEPQRSQFRFIGEEKVKGKTESVGVYAL